MTLQQLKYVIYIAETNSLSKASKLAFISQPSMSASLKELEKEIGVQLFMRNNKGIIITAEGIEFLAYAKQVVLQYSLIEDKYISKKTTKKRFAISTQHYSFAVRAFINMASNFDMAEYELAIRETKTHEVIDDVRYLRSELGILYVNDFNRDIFSKIFNDYNLQFNSLCICEVYVYMWKGNPLAKESILTLDQLEAYPCMSFEQGDENAFYFAEEVLSTHKHKRVIKANDRATMLNLMKGLCGYTFCSGVISQDLNGDEYIAIPLNTTEKMEIGYIKQKNFELSELGIMYIDEIMRILSF